MILAFVVATAVVGLYFWIVCVDFKRTEADLARAMIRHTKIDRGEMIDVECVSWSPRELVMDENQERKRNP